MYKYFFVSNNVYIFTYHLKTTDMNQEFVIWGVAKGEKDEDILYTKATTINEAKAVIKVLETKYKCTNCRIQVIDFSAGIDFTKTINWKN